MKLQADPTVVYGLGLDENKIGIEEFYSHILKLILPYNTYTRKGLPPTPYVILERCYSLQYYIPQ